MSKTKRIEFDLFQLPTGRPTPSAGAWAYQLMEMIEQLAESADDRDREYIAWRARQMAENLDFLASEASVAQRERLSQQACPPDHCLLSHAA